MENRVFLQDDSSDKHLQSSNFAPFPPDHTPPNEEPAIEEVETLILPVIGEKAGSLPVLPALSSPPRQKGMLHRRALFIVLGMILVLLLSSGGYVLARPNLPASSATLSITPISQQFTRTYSVTWLGRPPDRNPLRRSTHL